MCTNKKKRASAGRRRSGPRPNFISTRTLTAKNELNYECEEMKRERDFFEEESDLQSLTAAQWKERAERAEQRAERAEQRALEAEKRAILAEAMVEKLRDEIDQLKAMLADKLESKEEKKAGNNEKME